MIRLYCRKKHKNKSDILCDECNELKEYAHFRLDKCPFGDEKMACADCEIHCYKPEMREKVQEMMRFSGPRLILYHPLDVFIHFLKDKK